jgi:hypothetical protein
MSARQFKNPGHAANDQLWRCAEFWQLGLSSARVSEGDPQAVGGLHWNRCRFMQSNMCAGILGLQRYQQLKSARKRMQSISYPRAAIQKLRKVQLYSGGTRLPTTESSRQCGIWPFWVNLYLPCRIAAYSNVSSHNEPIRHPALQQSIAFVHRLAPCACHNCVVGSVDVCYSSVFEGGHFNGIRCGSPAICCELL